MSKFFKILTIVLTFNFINISLIFAQKKEPENIEELLNWLGNQIYVAAEKTGGNPEKWSNFQSEALAKYEKIIAETPEALTARNENDQTPLQLATIRGYDFLTLRMLQEESVRSSIDHKDINGLTARDHAILALRLSLFACNPKAMENPFALIPLLVTLPYYNYYKPFAKISNELSKFENNIDDENARTYWLNKCKLASPSTNEIVLESTNLQSDLINLGKKVFLDKQLQEYEKKMEIFVEHFEKKHGKEYANDMRKQLREDWLKKQDWLKEF